jgi:hypothetical protein
MTGYPQFNIPAFDALAAELRAVPLSDDLGGGFLEVVSPAELDDPRVREISLASETGDIQTLETHGATWGDFLARDVKMLADDGIEAVVVLPGWEKSRGARLETYVANAICGLPILTYAGNGTFMRVAYLDLVRAWTQKEDISFEVPHYA